MKSMSARVRRLMIMTLLITSILVSGCSDNEWDAFWNYAEAWAWASGVWDGEDVNYGKLSQELAGDAVDQVVGGPDQTALEAEDVVDDIRQADYLVTEAAKAAARGPAGQETALDAASDAIRLRPDDYSYVQRRAAIYLAGGDTDAYHQDIMDSYEIMQRSVGHGQDCQLAHRNFYQQQLAALENQSNLAPNPVAESQIELQISDVQLSLDHPEDWACP